MRIGTIAPLAVIFGLAAGCGGGSNAPPASATTPDPDPPPAGDVALEALNWDEGAWDEVVWQ